MARVFKPLLDDARYKGAHGGRGCLHPDTLIDTPKGQVKVKDFKGGEVYSWSSEGLVVADATEANPYTEEDLFEVELADGRKIIATDQHKFLTKRGWVELADLSMCDEVCSLPLQETSGLPLTSSGSDQKELLSGVPHYSKTLSGYLDDCLLCLHQYGLQLQSVVGSALASPPLRGDEQLHNYRALCHLGGKDVGGTHTPSLAFPRPSSRGALQDVAARYCEELGNRIGERSSERLSESCQYNQLFRGYICLVMLTYTLRGLLQDFGSLMCLVGSSQKPSDRLQSDVFDVTCGSPILFETTSVTGIRYHSHHTYWDLHVFGTNNYLSNGIVNHNSGKSHFFAEQLIEDSLCEPGLLSVCIREVQKSLKESAYRLITAKLKELELGEKDGFKIWKDRIETPGDGQIIFQGMQDHTAESIKSLEGFKRAWVEESQTLSALSMRLLRPTIRAEGSQIWFSWNPRRKNDPVDELLRQGELPTNSVVVQANWSDNPWFPKVLEAERQDCFHQDQDQYGHIWDGDYISVAEGAYYAKHLAAARKDGRVSRLRADPLLPFKLFVDIGGTGAKADAFSMWCGQFVGKETRVLNYYEVQGQPLEYHLNWMRENSYKKSNTKIYLPHDGSTNDRVYDVSYESAFKQAGYDVEVIPNQGKGAASARIEAGRRIFPNCWFDAERCEGGLEALGWYHEKKDEVRNIGLGPEHDWSSHGADAFGLMAVVRERPAPKWDKIDYPRQGIV